MLAGSRLQVFCKLTQEEPPASAPADGSGGWGHFAGGGARAAAGMRFKTRPTIAFRTTVHYVRRRNVIELCPKRKVEHVLLQTTFSFPPPPLSPRRPPSAAPRRHTPHPPRRLPRRRRRWRHPRTRMPPVLPPLRLPVAAVVPSLGWARS